MNLNKKLLTVKKCPICSKKEFTNQGKAEGIHKDISRLFDLIKCLNCNHCFLSKMPSNLFLEGLYKKNSEYVIKKGFLVNLPRNYYLRLKTTPNHWIFDFMKNKKKGNYLEVGPGDCSLLKTFRDNGWKCEGLELIKIFKVKGVHDDIKKINKKNKNVLVFHDILEHVADPLSILKKFSKKQSSGDKLFLAYPNASSFKAKILKGRWEMILPLSHLNFFSIDSTKILLDKCGYKVLSIKAHSSVSLKRLIRSILRLPITLVIDLFNLKISDAFNRFPEIFLNILDIFNGDQLHVIATKK